MDLRVAVPFHEAVLGGRKRVGLDAYFWPHLEQYRVVLLVHPAEKLYEQPPSSVYRLEPLVGPDRQARDLATVSRMRVEGARGPRLGLYTRLALIFAPWLVASQLKKLEARVPEEAHARMVAEFIAGKGLEPTGRILWMVFRETRSGSLLLPEEESMARVYSIIAERDKGYVQAVDKILREASRRL